MLRSLSSSSRSFKQLHFRPGLNIILAERASVDEATDSEQTRRTRNGAGKSSILDLVHFLLGGKPTGALLSDSLKSWSFGLEIDLHREAVTAVRSTGNDKQVTVISSAGDPEPITNAAWCHRLGEAWFNLAGERATGTLSYRQLIAYFARRRRDGGYDRPVNTYRNQTVASSETQLAHLFGLDAELVRRLHAAKATLKQIQSAQKALSQSDKEAGDGQRRADLEAQLEAQIAATQLSRDRLREQVGTFNVLPAFRDLERELAALNQEVRDLSDQDVIDAEVIEVTTRAMQAEDGAPTPDLQQLFSEAEVVFPKLVAARYSDVVQFHQRLIENRRAHLESEIFSARRRIEVRQPERERAEARRRQIVSSLRASGPADELLRLRDELSGREADLRGLQGRLTQARTLDDREDQLKIDIDEAVKALRQDRRERSALVEEASLAFSEISQRLYERPGQLAISASENGLRFLPKAPSDASAGIMSMEIFCFDLTISALAARRNFGPGFLIHDSHLFEPVDGRQFAKALRIGAQFSSETGIQYIVTLNSDELIRAQSESGEDFSEFVISPTLSDEPEGGLFGVRFD